MSKVKLAYKIAIKGKIELVMVVIFSIIIISVNMCGEEPVAGIINSLATSAVITIGWNLVTKYNNAKHSYIQITTLMRILIDKLSNSKDVEGATITVKDIKPLKSDINSTYINIYAAVSDMLVTSECDEITSAIRDIMYKIGHEPDDISVDHNIEKLKKSLNDFNWR